MSAELFNHLWQSTLCIGVAAALAWACRRTGAHVRYGIWLAASLKFLVPFSLLTALGSQLGWASPERASRVYWNAVEVMAAPVSAAEAPSLVVTHASASTADWFLVAWAFGAVALAERFHLRTHVAKDDVYVLELAPGAVEHSSESLERVIGSNSERQPTVSFRDASSANIANALSKILSSQVLDHTRSRDTYSFEFQWSRGDVQALGNQLREQGGLLLKSFPREQLVIDGAGYPTLDAAEQIVAR